MNKVVSINMRARYYDAELGRFLKEDPIRIAGGLNVSLYAGANPIVHIDPTGLVPPHDTSGLKEEHLPENVANDPPSMLSFHPFFGGGSVSVRGQNLDSESQRSHDGSLSRQQLTDLGNYNFGVTGAARDYELDTLHTIGDIDQHGIVPGIGKQDCYFCMPTDNARDAQMITNGFNDFNDGIFGATQCSPGG